MEFSKTTVQDRPSAPDVRRSELGRYRLVRELGAGGMGVVWEAFDPDLERKLAIKLLRIAGGDAEERLLREARAMAKLAHPNVVTVYEVGTADATDYVAMELIDGESLVDWLRGGKRSTAEILDAFRDAGRGLAAAHAAGIVHRDFKPHNVLRSASGRIAVTDFGLARSSGPVQADVGRELTATGTVVGTPAYMAPEQWNGDPITPATDQFAFCVALWEAFAAARPYRGATVDELRAHMSEGPDALDASAIPRRLRSVLRRGLALEPERRWPNMDALLAQLVSPRWPLVAAAGAVVAAGGTVALVLRGGSVDEVCPPPPRDLDIVWPTGSSARLGAAGKVDAARTLDDVAHRLATGRGRACELPAKQRDAALACYDAAYDRFAAIAYATPDIPGAIVVPSEWLFDPVMCDADPPPKLARTPPEVAALLAMLWRTPGNATVTLAARDSANPCARALAHLNISETIIRAPDKADRELLAAQQDSDRCDDDDLRAATATLSAALAVVRDLGGPGVDLKFKLADDAVRRTHSPQRVLNLHRLHAMTAEISGNVDELIADSNAMLAAATSPDIAGPRLGIEFGAIMARGVRENPDDLRTVGPALSSLRSRAAARFGDRHELVKQIDEALIEWQLERDGDVPQAHAALERLREPTPNPGGPTLHGRVVDAHGTPLAGATVAADVKLRGDNVSIVSGRSGSLRVTKTGADGTFELQNVVARGRVIAERGDRRSPSVPIAEGVVLTLAPTARIDGRIAMHGVPAGRFEVKARPSGQRDHNDDGTIGVVLPDGTFAIVGAPRGRVNVQTMVRDGLRIRVASRDLDVRQPAMRVELDFPHTARRLDVIARNTMSVAHPHSLAIIVTGTHHEIEGSQLEGWDGQITAALALEVDPARLPAAFAKRIDTMSSYAAFDIVPEGPISACAVALPTLLSDFSSDHLFDVLNKMKLHCTPIEPNDTAVVVDVDPLRRID